MKLPLRLVLLLALLTGLATAEEPYIPTHTAQVQAYFAPGSECGPAVERAIAAEMASKASTRGIYVLAYYFTSNEMARALLDAQNAGVPVEVVLDDRGSRFSYSQRNWLVGRRIPTFLDAQHPIMHDKVMLLRATRVILTGSMNFSPTGATRNAENLLAIGGNTALWDAYKRHYDAHRAHATPARLWRPPVKKAPVLPPVRILPAKKVSR